jgi:hypothetical protein
MLTRVPELGLARCDLLLVTHEETRKTPGVRAVTTFLVELMQRNRAAIEG